jgi:hypothetical protein
MMTGDPVRAAAFIAVSALSVLLIMIAHAAASHSLRASARAG